MLINIIKEGDVISVRLSTGEEVLCTLVKDAYEKSEKLEVSTPMVVARAPDGNMGLIPFMITAAADKITLSSKHVMSFAKTDDNIAKVYLEQTSNILR
jgi:Na+-translocating ferredoxin:NAD+ oxidoreductase RnfG subunit